MQNTFAPKVFTFEEKQLRTVEDENGGTWFLAEDVCDILEIQNATRTAQEDLDEDEKGIRNVYTPGGMQKMTVINEHGVYKIAFKRRSLITENGISFPEAKLP